MDYGLLLCIPMHASCAFLTGLLIVPHLLLIMGINSWACSQGGVDLWTFHCCEILLISSCFSWINVVSIAWTFILQLWVVLQCVKWPLLTLFMIVGCKPWMGLLKAIWSNCLCRP